MRAEPRLESGELSAPPPFNPLRHALFLDLDGTLAPIASDPAAVTLDADARDVIMRATSASGGAVAILTGRTVADADRILRMRLPHIAGTHGLELRAGAVTTSAGYNAAALRAAIRDVQAHFSRGAAPRLEDKGASIALHYRHAPDLEAPLRNVAQRTAARRGLRTLEGKMVIELLAAAGTKADALRAFMSAPPFTGRTPVAIGDDVTDEAAFEAAQSTGGVAVLVGERRQTTAAHHLADPSAVIAWIAAGLERAP
ncbi:MAG: trehalose-phosphatase [Hyphomonadaceae bacterium]|nr:trehalose-phosphatase [Hyphomonadaceae bacterium]MBX3511005.1 trehalose-phosphatase [Hyphomonadaceae bacterium]